MTPKEEFAADYTIALLVGLPIILDTGCCPADVEAGMKHFGFPCLTDAGNRFVLWNGFSQRECRPWSPCKYPQDTEEWVIKDANKRKCTVLRLSAPDGKPVAIITDYSPTEAKVNCNCEGDTPSQAACLAFIEAFKDTLTCGQLDRITASTNIEQQSWEAYQRGDSIPLKERIAQLQLEVAQQALDARKCQQAIAMMEHGSVCALSVLDEGGFHITTKQTGQIRFEGDDTPAGATSITISSTYTNISLADAIISAGTPQHGSTGV